MKKYVILLILTAFVLSCYNESKDIEKEEKSVDIKEEKETEITESININPNNQDGYKNLLKLLKEDKVDQIENNEAFIKYSPKKKYAFIASNYIDMPPDNDEEIEEKCWWVIYDYNKKDIVINDTGLILMGSFNWVEDKDYFYFNLGTDVPRYLVFYNLKNKQQAPVELNSVATIDFDIDISKGFYFSNDIKYVVWYYWIYFEHGEPDKLKIGVKIRNIAEKKEIEINENIEGKTLEQIFNENKDKI
jgi:hypothetical protein